MGNRLLCVAALTALALLAAASTAVADTTLGTTTQPAGSTLGVCNGGYVGVQTASTQDVQYTVPAPGGKITQWRTNTAGDTAGTNTALVVVRPSGGTYTVVGVDPETITTTSGVATFTVASPIAVNAGDLIGMYVPTSPSITCAWQGVAPLLNGDTFSLLLSASLPTAGSSLTSAASVPNTLANLAVNLAPNNVDAAVTAAAQPSGASAGQAALLSSTVTNNGPGGGSPITFTDAVPPGMTVVSALAGNGTCSVSGQTVTCTITGLSAGQSAPVAVVVVPSSPGSYTNHVAVTLPSGVTDPNGANNSASATLNVVLSLPAKCVVPSLKGASPALARTVLKELGCKVKSAKAHSKSVRKGSVIKTKPGRGTYAYQRVITLVVSSGPKKHHK